MLSSHTGLQTWRLGQLLHTHWGHPANAWGPVWGSGARTVPAAEVWVATEIFPSGQGCGLEACLPHSDLWLQGCPGFPRIEYSSMQQLQPKGLPFWQAALFGFCSLTVTRFLIVGVGRHGCSQKKCPSFPECYIFLWVLWSCFHSHLHSINIYWSINKKVARKPLTTPLPHLILSPGLWLRGQKHLLTMRENWVRSLGREDSLEKEMATHCNTLAWKIPWLEEPRRLQSIGSQRVGHDWATLLYFLLYCTL